MRREYGGFVTQRNDLISQKYINKHVGNREHLFYPDGSHTGAIVQRML